MEEKHIYTSSRWVKFIDTFKSYKKSLKEILPQFPKPKTDIEADLHPIAFVRFGPSQGLGQPGRDSLSVPHQDICESRA